MFKGLGEAGHHVDPVADGREGLALGLHGGHDVLIIDRALPGLDGLAIVKDLRAARVHTPIVLLSAIDTPEERVAGLEAGADDYIGKPFAFSELAARLAALCRRPLALVERSTLAVADLELDVTSRTVRRAGVDLRWKMTAGLDTVFMYAHIPGIVTFPSVPSRCA